MLQNEHLHDSLKFNLISFHSIYQILTKEKDFMSDFIPDKIFIKINLLKEFYGLFGFKDRTKESIEFDNNIKKISTKLNTKISEDKKLEITKIIIYMTKLLIDKVNYEFIVLKKNSHYLDKSDPLFQFDTYKINPISKILNNLTKAIDNFDLKYKEDFRNNTPFHHFDIEINIYNQMRFIYSLYNILIKGDFKYIKDSNYIEIKTDIKKYREVIDNVLHWYDEYNITRIQFDYDKNDFALSLTNISEGELSYLNFWVNLYTKINNCIQQRKNRNILFLFDEPEKGFHPEWSRKFIYNLVNFLENIKLIKGLDNIQIIIASHSPFIVSDFRKENVKTIKICKNGNRTYDNPNKSFMANFYDIIQDGFFLDSPIGEFSKNKLENILTKIESLSIYAQTSITEIENEIKIIEDDNIKNMLLQKLDRKIKKILSFNEIEYWKYKKTKIDKKIRELSNDKN